MVQKCMNSVYWCLYMKIWKYHRKADHLPQLFLGGIYTAWQCMYRWANSCTIALLITIRKAVQAHMHFTCIKCVLLMYNGCTCLYNVCTRLYNVCTCATHVQFIDMMYNVCTCLYIVCTCIYTVHNFNQLSQQVFGFRGSGMMGNEVWLWTCTDVSVLCPYIY